VSDHLEQAKRSLRRLEDGYHEADWAQVDATRAVAEATVALAEEMRRANKLKFLTLPWDEQRRVAPNLTGPTNRAAAIKDLYADLFPDEENES
jgi:hypothetical protein